MDGRTGIALDRNVITLSQPTMDEDGGRRRGMDLESGSVVEIDEEKKKRSDTCGRLPVSGYGR